MKDKRGFSVVVKHEYLRGESNCFSLKAVVLGRVWEMRKKKSENS